LNIKSCSKCNQDKIISNFQKKKSNKDGYSNICKSCISIRNKEYRTKVKNGSHIPVKIEKQEDVIANGGRVCKTCGKFTSLEKLYGLRAKCLECQNIHIKYRKINEPKFKEKRQEHSRNGSRKLREVKPEETRNYHRIYDQNWRIINKEKSKIYVLRSYAKQNNYGFDLTEEELNNIYQKFQNKCFRCSSDKNLSLDHHYPAKAGYPLIFGNCVILCKSCNSKKHGKMPEDFYSEEEIKELRELGIISIYEPEWCGHDFY